MDQSPPPRHRSTARIFEAIFEFGKLIPLNILWVLSLATGVHAKEVKRTRPFEDRSRYDAVTIQATPGGSRKKRQGKILS